MKHQNIDNIHTNDEFNNIVEFVENTNSNVFITGKAGTGKSTLLKHITEHTGKNYVVLAPTGIAALNVGGQTIHSFFRFSNSIINPEKIKIDRDRSGLFESLDMVIIDEISMVRVDLIDGIDLSLRRNRSKNDVPFGGVQMVFFGDLFQLPPILQDGDWAILEPDYKNKYFFDAQVFRNSQYKTYELTKIFRQNEGEKDFISILNNVRVNTPSDTDIKKLNSRLQNVNSDDEYIYLTARRETADTKNNEKLAQLSGYKKVYQGEISAGFGDDNNSDYRYPAPLQLELKKDARIMMLNNDSGKRWVNGTRGRIEKLENDKIIVNLNGISHEVLPHTWKKTEYVFDKETKKIVEKPAGSYTQFPIQLAYAITIHKSQGMTFDKAIIDIGKGAFAHGQVYVALSRCRSFENMYINNPIQESDIFVDPVVVEFYNTLLSPKEKKLDSKIDLKAEFEKDLVNYLKKIADAGFDTTGVNNILRSKGSILDGALFLLNNDKTSQLWVLNKKLHVAQFSIEALSLKKKYGALIPHNLRIKAEQKLQNVDFDFATFNYDEI